MKMLIGVLVAALSLLVAASAQAQSWQEVRPTGGGYRMEMPAAPEYGTESIPLDDGRRVAMQTAIAEFGNMALLGSYVDYPPEAVAGRSPDDMLNNVMNGSARGHRLVSQRSLNIAGYPAREYIIERTNGVVLVTRSVVVRNRLYQLVAAGTRGVEGNPNARRFLDSFALTAR